MKKNIKFILLILILFVAPSNVFASSGLTIMPIDTGNWGDATLLESNGQYLLMDVTSGAVSPNASNVDNDSLLDFLIANNVKKFDLYLSHYHVDHFGDYSKLTTTGSHMTLMKYILLNKGAGGYKDYVYDIGKLYLPDPAICYASDETACEKTYVSLKDAATKMGVKVVILKTGSTFSVGNAKANVLYLNTDASIINDSLVPDKDSLINNSSLVTMFTIGNKKFLTAGDIEQYAENKILQLGIDIQADIFKMSHHGTHDSAVAISNTQKFVERVRPKYSYVQFRTSKGVNYNLIATSVKNLGGFSNLYSSEVNGNFKFVIENNVIIPSVERSGYTITLNYVDKESNIVLDTRKYDFSYNFYGDSIKYHLYDYIKVFNGYTFKSLSNGFTTPGILSKDITYNLYYTKNNYKLTVRHIDSDSKSLIADETKTYKFNSSYSVSASQKLLENYILVSDSSNVNGVITGDVTVTFQYKKKTSDATDIVDKPNNSDSDNISGDKEDSNTNNDVNTPNDNTDSNINNDANTPDDNTDSNINNDANTPDDNTDSNINNDINITDQNAEDDFKIVVINAVVVIILAIFAWDSYIIFSKKI